MSLKKLGALAFTFFLLCVATAAARTLSDDVQMIEVEELKRKVDAREPVTIIDVRASDAFLDSGGKIKGAIHVRPRRLRSRLAVAPLKDLPRDREVVTYCACPSDEAAVRAAQLLSAAGFKRVRVLRGGWQAWLGAGGQVESKPKL